MKKPRFRRPISAFVICIAILTSCVVLSFIIDRLAFAGNLVSSFMSAVTPFVIGGILAFILKPMCNLLDKPIGDFYVNRVFARRLESGRTTEKRVRRGAEMTSILITMLTFFAIILALLYMVIPRFIESIRQLIQDIPTYARNIADWIIKMIGDGNPELVAQINSFMENFNSGFASWIKTLTPFIQSFLSSGDAGLGSVLDIVMGTISVGKLLVNIILDTIVSIVVTVYALAGRKKFTQQGRLLIISIFPKRWADIILDEIKYINFVFSRYVSGRMLDSMLVGVLIFIACSIFRIPQAPLVSVLVGASNMIPFFGPYIGTIPSALIILMTDPIKAIYFLILVLIIQQIDSNILDPFVVGNSIDMSSFWILFSVLLFGGLYGFAGLLLGVPAFTIIYDIIRKLTAYALRRRGEQELIDGYNKEFHDPTEEASFLRERARSIRQARKNGEAVAIADPVTVEDLVHEAQASGTTEAEIIEDSPAVKPGEPEITIPIPLAALEEIAQAEKAASAAENGEAPPAEPQTNVPVGQASEERNA